MQLPILAILTYATLLDLVAAFPGYDIHKFRSLSVTAGSEDSAKPALLNTSPSDSSIIIYSKNSHQREIQHEKYGEITFDNSLDQRPVSDSTLPQNLSLCKSTTDFSMNHGQAYNDLCQNDIEDTNSKEKSFITHFFNDLLEFFFGLKKALSVWNFKQTTDVASTGSDNQPQCSSWSSCTNIPEYARSFSKDGLKRRLLNNKENNNAGQKSYPLPTPESLKAGASKQRLNQLPTNLDTTNQNGQGIRKSNPYLTTSIVNGKRVIGQRLPAPPQNTKNAVGTSRSGLLASPPTRGSNSRVSYKLPTPESIGA
ncbi:hypothetical protein EV44_g0572 [Erysiphe necator]|uniref:Uncharacterized protein n=1 Tax=Uncinula necator TaxID=52586 RepID=A0A0B1P3N2_UNCNE|nr:hypothetical protein EV44_g0572 [Erysiphe necator]